MGGLHHYNLSAVIFPRLPPRTRRHHFPLDPAKPNRLQSRHTPQHRRHQSRRTSNSPAPIDVIQDQDPNVTTVNALAQAPDGIVYAGTGPKAILLAINGKKVTTAATIDNAVNILSLEVDSNGGILHRHPGGDEKAESSDSPSPATNPPKSFSRTAFNMFGRYSKPPTATSTPPPGPTDRSSRSNPTAPTKNSTRASEDNITSMISDGKDNLYLGTDPDGLVIRLDRKTAKTFIVYNAGEIRNHRPRGSTTPAVTSTPPPLRPGQRSSNRPASFPSNPTKLPVVPKIPNSSNPIPRPIAASQAAPAAAASQSKSRRTQTHPQGSRNRQSPSRFPPR